MEEKRWRWRGQGVWRRLLCAVVALWLGHAAWAAENRFKPLLYAEAAGWVAPQEAPDTVCDLWADVWRWDEGDFSYALELELPARWRCQRFYKGAREPNQYTFILGRCQRAPAPIRTGSDWSHPLYDMNNSLPCSCTSPKLFDRAVEWCTASPSCLAYPDNKASDCGKTVDDLLKVVKAPTDPRRFFHATQTCIAQRSCDARCQMENCDWLRKVIPDFVNPYLLKAADWSAVEAECRSRKSNWVNDQRCAERMARNHINNDLIPALRRSGCGSDADWRKVFAYIEQCTTETMSSTVERWAARTLVSMYRERARSACVSERISAGLAPDINDELKGRTCRP